MISLNKEEKRDENMSTPRPCFTH